MAEEAPERAREDDAPPPAPDAEPTPPAGRRPLRWRRWLRSLHRDAGYLAVGLTFVYALSGLAVNHIADIDPSYTSFDRTHPLPEQALPADDDAAAALVLRRLGIEQTPSSVYRASESELTISFERRNLTVDTAAGVIYDQGQRPRFFFRVANWLHLNRGKRAWTYIADAYAVMLIFLAISGSLMLPGRQGLLGRGGILITIGVAVPILYVCLAGP